MGDVLIAEPIISALRGHFNHVTMYTDFPHVAALMAVVDECRPYPEHLNISEEMFDRVICPVYEIYPGINHLDGFGLSVGVEPKHRVPVIRRGFPRVHHGPYGLIAPHTSNFVRSMREWPESRFAELAQCLNEHSGIPFIVLRPSHSFCEMLSLIEHCELFVGNDSGPAILAQCFGRATFVILGATRPDLVLLSDDAIGIIKDVGCNGCKHFARHTDIICASPTCLAELSVEDVFGQVIAAWKV